MKLLISTTSPYARWARVVVLEKQIACECEVASPWDDDAQVLAHNPLRRIPILLTADAGALVESRLICEYLDAQNDTPRLLPQAGAARTAALQRVGLAEGALDSAVAIILAGKVSPGMATDAWKQWLMTKVNRALDYFENDERGRAPQQLDMGEIALGCLLGFLDFRMPDYDWRGERGGVAARWEALSARPSFAQTVPHL